MAQVTPKGHGLGYRPDLPDIRDYFVESAPMGLALPDRVDLRESHDLPASYDQGRLGSCTANGWAFMVEYELIVQGLRDLMGIPSRLQIYYDERALDGTTAYDSGAQVRDGAKVLANTGVAHGKLWPYDISKFTEKPPANAYADALKFRAVEYAHVIQAQYDMQAALASFHPIVFGCTLYASFEDQRTISTGIVPMPSVGERVLGGHCMVIVGYELIGGQSYFIVRNSWGTSVGQDGHFFMPADYLTNPRLATDLWVLTQMQAGS